VSLGARALQTDIANRCVRSTQARAQTTDRKIQKVSKVLTRARYHALTMPSTEQDSAGEGSMPPSNHPINHRWAGPIPYTLSPHLCIEFVNSRFENYTGTGEIYDRLEMARWREWFLDRAGIPVKQPPAPETFHELVHVRTMLRELLGLRARPAPRTMSWINRYLAASPPMWQLRCTGAGVEMHVTWDADWTGVIAAILTSYGRLLENGTIDRVRECANPHCTWMFYDQSRNATRRWCDPQACGNLHNVHAHRERSRNRSRS
jgi:predicted RNA-binding Zn ribbon-like protein